METNETNKGKYTLKTFLKTQKQKKIKKRNKIGSKQKRKKLIVMKKNIPKGKYGLFSFFKL
jgi:hypothetical protein